MREALEVLQQLKIEYDEIFAAGWDNPSLPLAMYGQSDDAGAAGVFFFLFQVFVLSQVVLVSCIDQSRWLGVVVSGHLASELVAPPVLLHSFHPLGVVSSGSGCLPFGLLSPTA